MKNQSEVGKKYKELFPDKKKKLKKWWIDELGYSQNALWLYLQGRRKNKAVVYLLTQKIEELWTEN